MRHMPQEIEVWYVLPAIRKEIAGCLIDIHGFSQKKVAEILGVTEAAVSQYVNNKRGVKESFFDKDIKRKISSFSYIIKDNEDAIKVITQICKYIRKSNILCRIHRGYDKAVAEDCRICFS